MNVGGGLEPGCEGATNLNPIKEGSGGPVKDIPNHVKAGFEDIADVFEPGSVKELFSNRLRFGDVDWARAARGAAKAVAPGGRVSLNIWVSAGQDIALVIQAFVDAGFKNVQAIGSGPGTVVTAVR